MKYILFLVLLFAILPAFAGDTTKLYNPYADVEKDMADLLIQAKKENKHIMIQVGGNWCIWCYRFNRFVEMDKELKTLQGNNFLVYHLNYSPENKNEAYLKKLGFPQRFGFPVIVILDADGHRLHTQDSTLLEQGNTYSTSKVKSFFINWSPNALKDIYYKE
ncbi:MAG TPA: thioredoxin family protein [Chitinophagaceae bacterium]|jgi:Thioredoxin-related protein